MINNITEIAEKVADAIEIRISKETDGLTISQIEQAMRSMVQEIGQEAVGIMLEREAKQHLGTSRKCVHDGCDQEAAYQRRRETRLHTLFGKVVIKRAYYLCECGKGHFPLDEQLGLRPNGLSAELERLVAMTGVQLPFGKGSELFEQLTLISISDPCMAKACQKVGEVVMEQEAEWEEKAMDCQWLDQHRRTTRAPLRYYGSIDAGKVHIKEDGEVGWRDLKIGTWFEASGTPPKTADGEWTIRAKNIRYFADIAPAKEFGNLFWATAVQHNAHLAQELIILGDGAEWIWNLVDQSFPYAIQILDWFHAVEHLTLVAQTVFEEEQEEKEWINQAKTFLWESDLSAFFTHIEQLQSDCSADVIRKTLNYFETHRERINYKHFRNQGYQIGSGTVESAAKQIGVMRMKVPGATWNFDNARKVAKARAAYLSDKWHSLPLAT